MERLTSRSYPKMGVGFCTEIECLVRDYCPSLQKHNRLFKYEETGVDPDKLQKTIDHLRVWYHATKGLEKAVCGEILDMLGVDKGEQ